MNKAKSSLTKSLNTSFSAGKSKRFRTPIKERSLPFYTKGEEILNTLSHTIGAALGIAALVLCVVFTVLKGNVWGTVAGSIYGSSLVILYTMSSVYHGIPSGTAKKVMQVLDHCTIYFLIAGSYTPVALCAIRTADAKAGWTLFGVVWGLALIAATLTAIDLKKFRVFSMICYIGMGWSIVFAAKPALASISATGLWYLLAGGISYTVGAILYGLGKKHRYMHSIFHVFVVAGSVLQFICIFFHILLK